ncbi:uncharacterized protein LOC105643143, partial [Jatropha curcas]|uniref:uncharacterized protein LOC105643143 n=1 Tax=Jatropha curcas TaxID=180498 RepID=UPI0018937433
LADVDAPVTNGRLVLRLTGSLPEAYGGMVDFIQNQEPLPSFESCHSRLKMVERTIKARHARENGGSGSRSGGAAMVAAHSSMMSDSSASNKRNNNNKGRGNSKNNGKKKAQQNYNGAGASQPTHSRHINQTVAASPRPNPAAQRPTSPGSGLLGPRPQVFNVVAPSASSFTTTNIEAAMHALSFSQPDGNYYMDTGATSHMTADADILSSYFNSSNKHHNIVVGSGHLLPIVGHGRTTLPPLLHHLP